LVIFVYVWKFTVDYGICKFRNVYAASSLFIYLENCKAYRINVMDMKCMFNPSLQLLCETPFSSNKCLVTLLKRCTDVHIWFLVVIVEFVQHKWILKWLCKFNKTAHIKFREKSVSCI